MSEDQEIKLVIVSEKVDDTDTPDVDPLEEEIASLKLTANLLKEMSFNSTVNKFDYFEKLLKEENTNFNSKIQNCVNNQKELVKKMKTLQKLSKDAKNQSSILNYAKVNVQLQELRTTKEETIKYQKLSQGMLKYLEKINEKLDKI